ncbi:PP2C family serine/threonine-protein phosphatase [Sporobolomyces salmoneus]|uniref:PP2C family serine/threonine-protein phosphatase n=1 Tax=Sporobolomyces salmoneus TaxID=183962 RepID=UPI00316BC379
MLRCTCLCSPYPIPTAAKSTLLSSAFAPQHRLLSSSTGFIQGLRAVEATKRIRFPQRRWVSDEQHFRTRFGNLKLNLNSKGAVGIAQSRGERPYQEDAYSVHSLAVPRSALKWNVVDDRLGAGWNPTTLEGFEGESPPGEEDETRRQVAFFGVFDGHGGAQSSKFLKQNLHNLLERARPDAIPSTIDEYRGIGGYLKRYQGGILERFRKDSENYNERKGISLDEMSTLAFLQADNQVLADESTGKSGSTATIALLHSLDLPHSFPYYASSLISLTVAHLGDTCCLLATSSQGRARRLTENHHGDSRVEGERLRTSGTGIVTDSFGESRWGGTLANTRGIGDREFKSLGVIGEPEITKRVLKGEEWSFLVLLSDGITDVISDQEIIDIARGYKDPTQAAKKIVSFAEDVGGEDNMTCIVVPLPGWGKMGGLDTTADRREYRLRQFSGASRRQKRM